MFKELIQPSITRTGKIKYNSDNLPGSEHTFWVVINSYFPPKMPWKTLSGAEKGQIYRAAEILDKHQIPYKCYAQFLHKFGKGKLIHRTPLLITGFKEKDGKHPLLSDFICIVTNLRKYPIKVIDILDCVYATLKDCFEHSIIQINYVADTISDALKNSSEDYIKKTIGKYDFLDEFLDHINKTAWKSVSTKIGVKNSVTAKLLVREYRIRKGRELGDVDTSLNKYFTKNNSFNKRALDIVRQ